MQLYSSCNWSITKLHLMMLKPEMFPCITYRYVIALILHPVQRVVIAQW